MITERPPGVVVPARPTWQTAGYRGQVTGDSHQDGPPASLSFRAEPTAPEPPPHRLSARAAGFGNSRLQGTGYRGQPPERPSRETVIPSGAHRARTATAPPPGGLPRNLPAPSDSPPPPPPPACARSAPRSVRFRRRTRLCGITRRLARCRRSRRTAVGARCAARALAAGAGWQSTSLAAAAAGFLGGPADIIAAAAAHRAPLGMTLSRKPVEARSAEVFPSPVRRPPREG